MNTPITIDVLLNDIYVPPVDVLVQDPPLPGTGSVDAPAEDGTITYNPPGDPGTYSFTYYITTAAGASNIATVTITVNP